MKNIFSRLRKLISPKSIKRKIQYYFASLTLIMIVASISLQVWVNHDIFDEYFTAGVTKRIESTDQEIDDMLKEISNSLDFVAESATSLPKGIAEQDYNLLDSCLRVYARVFNLHSYVLTDTHGGIISTSIRKYDDDDKANIGRLANYVMEKGSSEGVALILEKDAGYYAARTIVDQSRKELGVLTFVKHSLGEEQYLTKRSQALGMQMTLFRDSVRVNTTLVDNNGVSMRGSVLNNREALENISKNKRFIAPTVIGGNRFYSFYHPLVDFDGQNVGTLWYGIDGGVRAELTRSITAIVFWSLIVIAFICSALYCKLINKDIIDPLIRLANYSEVLSKGDLTAKEDNLTYKYEVGILQKSVNEMARSIRRVLGPIVEMSQQLHTASAELSKASQSLSNSANHQAASLEEISSSMQEIGGNIQNNMGNSNKANQLSSEIGSDVNTISVASSNSLKAVHGISQDIVAINELVMQTNILSLNASVEAARAGAYGQGFGVVAKEVGRLAEQTKMAAQTITDTAQNSISETENSSQKLNDVLPKLDVVIDLVKEINAACIEQNSGVSQVNTAIIDLNTVTQQMASSAEEISANSEELAGTAASLSEMVSFFKI